MRAFVGGVCLLLSGCAGQTVPLEPGAEASRLFLVGDWFGTYEWPTDSFAALWTEWRAAQRAQAIAGTLTEGRLFLKYLDRFTLSRVADDRLAGEAWISTRGGLQGTRMERIDTNLRQQGKWAG